MMKKRVFAISAHPDDIEFMMAGTFLLLGKAGYELHYMTLANGSCGTVDQDRDSIVRIRTQEARNAAAFAGAIYHEPLVDDLDIYYERSILTRLSSIIRQVSPEIILTHSPDEYMEDHSNTCRLVLTAAFTRGMPNYPVNPPSDAVDQPVTIYHALPHSLIDPLCNPVIPGMYVDISSIMQEKVKMLSMHQSQKEWLDKSQGMDSYLHEMKNLCQEIGRLSNKFEYAEGWRKHLHLGYCDASAAPIEDALGQYVYIP